MRGIEFSFTVDYNSRDTLIPFELQIEITTTRQAIMAGGSLIPTD